MISRIKLYLNTKFKAEDILEIYSAFLEDVKDLVPGYKNLYVQRDLAIWNQENDDEFFSDYRNPDAVKANFEKHFHPLKDFEGSSFIVLWENNNTTITIKSDKRDKILKIFEKFEKLVASSKIINLKDGAKTPTIFIGHGSSLIWKELKDHLHEKHSYQVEAYEIGDRAGDGIRDILEAMLKKSSFAILVMTGEDEGKDGKFHARDNVIHELGLFQGRLGFNKAIVLLEKGTEEFSNIHGIQQIRFQKNNIKETFGDVLAALHREEALK